MNYDQLLSEVEIYVRSFFKEHHDPRFIYHDIQHTEHVVRAVKEIANHFQINNLDFFIVVTAAWFHDSGYFVDANRHETEGALLAATFLKDKNQPDTVIESIKECILATHLPQNPKNLLEQIVCDGDLYHLGTDAFVQTNKLMRKEVEALKDTKISGKQWRASAIKLLEDHQYQTDYCRLLLNDTKRKNLKRLQAKSEKKEQEQILTPVSIATSEPELPIEDKKNKAEEKDKDKEAKKRPDKGIETMFRITSGNNQRLSNMADNKAHILITVNSIILSAIISLLLRKLDANAFLEIPTYLLLTVCVLAIIFSILATRPSLPKGVFTEEDIANKKVNLLFFGNFYKMSLESYTEGMLKVMEDRDFLYGSLIRDVYSQGIVLGRKYKLLRISYNIFMFGLVISVLAFIIATMSVSN